jgi:hypothetical protein
MSVPGMSGLLAQAARCEDQLARHLGAAIAVYGAGAIDVIDLPPMAETPIDADALRVAAVLLWTSEVESAGIPGFVEALAEAVAEGRFIADLGAGGDPLLRWWRQRQQRFTSEERHALYERMFGAASGFPEAFADLLQTLDALGRLRAFDDPGHLRAHVAQAASTLAVPLAQRATGIAAFAARDLTAQIRTALALLADPDVQTALGGGQGPWNMIRLHGTVLMGRTPDCATHLARARHGHALITWLADHTDQLITGNLPVAPGDAAVSAAQGWIATETG